MIFKPTLKLDKITDITAEMLENYGIKALILDVDNTMSTHHGDILTDGLTEWLKNMNKCGIKTVIVSNSKKKRVSAFAQKIGLDFISLGLKPLPNGFYKARKKLRVKKERIAAVGDQIFTDVLGGNLYGIKTVLLTPIKPEKSLRFKFKRRLEKIIYKHYGW